MKSTWFKDWLEQEDYEFWYEEGENEVWRNEKFVIVWHHLFGMRLMVWRYQFSEGYLCKKFIPNTLARQEE